MNTEEWDLQFLSTGRLFYCYWCLGWVPQKRMLESVLTGRMSFQLPNEQHQSAEVEELVDWAKADCASITVGPTMLCDVWFVIRYSSRMCIEETISMCVCVCTASGTGSSAAGWVHFPLEIRDTLASRTRSSSTPMTRLCFSPAPVFSHTCVLAPSLLFWLALMAVRVALSVTDLMCDKCGCTGCSSFNNNINSNCLRPLCWSSWHPQLRTRGFCCSKALLSICPFWWHLAHLDWRRC